MANPSSFHADLSFWTWMLGSGLVGLLLRYGTDAHLAPRLGWSDSSFPVAIFLINLLGCFLAGVLFAWVRSSHVDPMTATALSYGLLGALTTFSAFSVQSFQLLEQKQWLIFAAYFVGSPVFGLLAAAVGFLGSAKWMGWTTQG